MKFTEATREQCNKFYREVGASNDVQTLRYLACNDLFFLLSRLLNRPDVDVDWLYDRIREFEASPDGHLDLWAREHYKSTIITFAASIQEVLKNPEVTIGIFSHTRPIATNFVRQIKNEFEGNEILQRLFPHILPPVGSESRPWGESMLCVKRKGNAKEQTLEAWGVVKGQPTSKHFDLRIYDDLVVPESVTTPEMIMKTTDMFALSENLGARGGRSRGIGTRYHHADSYATMIERGVFKPRIHAATKNGQPDGIPVFLTAEELAYKRQSMGPYIFGCQMLQSPSPDEGAIFRKAWLKRWDRLPERFHTELISLDCTFKEESKSKKGVIDYVVAQYWGRYDADAYLIDQIRGQWDFVDTLDNFVEFIKKHPGAVMKLVEDKANGPAIISTLKRKVPGIIPVEPFGSKTARAHSVTPVFESGNVYIPHDNYAPWVPGFVLETTQFPIVAHDDQVDAMTQAVQRLFNKAPIKISAEVLSKRRKAHAVRWRAA